MKVLWFTNIELNAISSKYGENSVLCGWLEQTAPLLSARDNIELYIASRSKQNYSGQMVDGICYYSFDDTSGALPERIATIIDAICPDVVHLWGTEYGYSLEVMRYLKAEGLEDIAVVSIQGLVSVYPYHYFANLPGKVIHHYTVKEIIKRTNIYRERRKMQKRGETEIQTLQMAKHCIGRTDWDYACVKQIHSDIHYHHGDEILRKAFYDGQWNISSCDRHTIFYSQAYYPIKGLHIMLEALHLLKKKYQDVRLRVLGENPIEKRFTDWLRRDSYQWYLAKKIREYHLEDSIEWLGRLNAEEMKAQYLCANIFASASSIENSSNSIGEAMLLGVPVVASDVGGIKSLMEHRKEGILFQESAFYMLADAIDLIFSDEQLATELGRNARLRAQNTHGRVKNIDQLIDVYSIISAFHP